MSLSQTVGRLVDKYGSDYTLRRSTAAAGANSWTAGVEAIDYYPCKGRERFFKPHEIQGAVNENDVLLTVDAVSLSVKPVRGDRIALGKLTADAGVGWFTVVNSYGPKVDDGTLVYKLHVRL